jgi:hypothetical protein
MWDASFVMLFLDVSKSDRDLCQKISTIMINIFLATYHTSHANTLQHCKTITLTVS